MNQIFKIVILNLFQNLIMLITNHYVNLRQAQVDENLAFKTAA